MNEDSKYIPIAEHMQIHKGRPFSHFILPIQLSVINSTKTKLVEEITTLDGRLLSLVLSKNLWALGG